MIAEHEDSSLGRKPRVSFAPVASWISQSELRAAGFEPGGRAAGDLDQRAAGGFSFAPAAELLADLQPVELPELLGQAHVVKTPRRSS